SRGWLETHHGLGIPVQHSQHHQEIPGERKRQPHGVVIEMTVHSVCESHVVADVRLDVTTPVTVDSSDFVATSGATQSVSGKFPADKATRIWLESETEN